MARVLICISTAALLASCTPIVDNRGHNLDATDFQQIVPGQTRTEDVEALLGSPSTKSTYGTETWYYINEQKETWGAFAPEITEQSVTAIMFDENHVVTSLEDRTKADGKPVQLVEKTTPSEGRHLTVMEQLLGNFGRFSAPGRQMSPRDIGR